MKISRLGIEGAFLLQSKVYTDARGDFREWYKYHQVKEEINSSFFPSQANFSISHKGVVRGIHYTIGEEKQSKYVTCASGRILDVIVDLRVNSPTFLKWVSLELDPSNGFSIYIEGGLGHAFMALEEQSVVVYMVNKDYDPTSERSIFALDPAIGINWPHSPVKLSDKDSIAPLVTEQLKMNNLPK